MAPQTLDALQKAHSRDQYKWAWYTFGGVALILVASALIWKKSFRFLRPTAPRDQEGKCPYQCCQACALNWPATLGFAALIGIAAGGLVYLIIRQRHQKMLNKAVSSVLKR